jgi:hypothetical protein
LKKADTSDGIFTNDKDDKFGRVQFCCPQGHLLHRHRRRDERNQYYCVECETFFTEESKLHHIKKDLSYYDKFIEDYIKISLKSEKPNVSDLCKKHKLSRATTYRHLFVKGKKTLLDGLVELAKWSILVLGNLYKYHVTEGNLVLSHRSTYKDFKVKLILKYTTSAKRTICIEGAFSQNISRFISKTSFVQFDADGSLFKVPVMHKIPPLSIQLDALEKIMKNI